MSDLSAALAKPPARFWGRTELDQNVWEAALDRMRFTYDTFDHIVVSFSGGKDSTCVLNVALEVAHERGELPVHVVFFDEEAISYQTEDYVRRCAARDDIDLEWYCLPVLHRNACCDDSPMWWPWAGEDRERWVRELPPEALTEMEGFPLDPPEARPSLPSAAEKLMCPFDRYGNTACVMGIRAAESLVRLQAVSNKRQDNYLITMRPGYTKAYPVYDWTTEDVWTAPAVLGWDHNESYDLMEMCGISHAAQRLAPPFGEEPIRDLWVWQRAFPEIWDKLCRRVPGAATAARYSTTGLYASFGAHVEKPDDQTWEEFIVARLREQPDEIRPTIAAKVRQLVQRHYKKTRDPLVGHAAHPVSGMSWEWLYRIADKGDLKDRRSASIGITHDPQTLARMTAAYEAEREAMEHGHHDDQGPATPA